MRLVPRVFAVCFALSAPPAEADDSLKVSVDAEADSIVVAASMSVPVSIEAAWDVLNDYDRQAEFIPNLEESRIISAPGEPLRVAQKKISRFGPLTFSFSSTWQVGLTPHRLIETRALSGDVEGMVGTTRLIGASDGTRIEYHASGMPKVWAPVIGRSLVESDIRERLEGMRNEMLRRESFRKKP